MLLFLIVAISFVIGSAPKVEEGGSHECAMLDRV